MSEKLITLINDFHPKPYGRYNKDCPTCPETSGEAFRTKILAKDLRAFDKVIVDLSGRNRYGRSFLDEAFGGLIRKDGFTKLDLDNKLIYKHDNLESILIIIEDRIKKAEQFRISGKELD
ncbi:MULTISPECIES: STAS-like domain-containing protein [unclassified Pseudoalteromonas]|uniref:STAS-like domain-containing protein n=1 Tax=unclassified Pseudoalteromonas TaxID=194690 RepID=UPI0015FAAFE0|nr:MULTISPECIES: STAS-like domain-containing protein [unclassified Pseudoalteromonas]MBB1380069.1 STAS-like domain-containing protein [Pseudoalteromonas sp. SR43-2]MBH0076130.1 STAS-like domain-containing protein [Pseudoalteromonas sp. SWYJ118]